MPTSVTSVKCRICENQLKSKNESLHTLRTQHNEQTVAFKNLTTYHSLCVGDKSGLQERVKDEEKKVMGLQGQIEVLERKAGTEQEAYASRVKGLRSIVQRMQRHLLCLQTEEQCQEESDQYQCLPRDVFAAAVLLEDVVGQELFGIATEHLLGDRTWYRLDWVKFKESSPQTYTTLLVLIVFASIGMVALSLLLVGGLIYYRRPINSGLQHVRACCTRTTAAPILKKKKGMSKVGLPTEEPQGDPLDPTPKPTPTGGKDGASGSTSGTKKDDLNAAWKKGDKPEEDPTVKIGKA